MSEYGDIPMAVLNVAIDTDKDAHHSLQLVIDNNIKISNDKVSFYHNGRIAVGNIGSGKVSDLRNLVGNLYPKIIQGDEFYFGTLVNNKLWTLADKDVIHLIVDLISYALIRDLYRAEVKKRKGE